MDHLHVHAEGSRACPFPTSYLPGTYFSQVHWQELLGLYSANLLVWWLLRLILVVGLPSSSFTQGLVGNGICLACKGALIVVGSIPCQPWLVTLNRPIYPTFTCAKHSCQQLPHRLARVGRGSEEKRRLSFSLRFPRLHVTCC